MNETVHANRKHKDSVFRMLYSRKEELLPLYNALNGTDYQDPGQLEVTTLENAIYMNMKNDVSFLLDAEMMLYEHQSTWNPNMPLRDLLQALCRYQSEEGRWYQVVDKGGQTGNWLENSCSCLYVAAICKAVRKGILENTYLTQAKKGYQAVIRSLDFSGGDLLIGQVCIGTGVGDYRHYCERPISVNDLHGVGAFLLMCTEAR